MTETNPFQMLRNRSLILFLILFCSGYRVSAQALPRGVRTDLQVDGRPAFVIIPNQAYTGNTLPWVWYAPALPGLPGPEENWMFDRFLEAGIAIAGIDVGESYGSPDGRKQFTALYEELTRNRNLATKPVLLGRSRGGLMTLSWAADHPGKVAAFAGIYPVCDLTSYPGIDQACGAYHLTAEEMTKVLSDHNPVDRLQPLAKAGIPLFAIHGDIDELVPLERNSGEVKRRYEALGGRMELIVPKGQGHNMWEGFFRSPELVKFVIENCQSGSTLLQIHPIDEVVITATRSGSLPANTPDPIQAVDQTAILDHQVRTASEALVLSPGVFVQKTTHGGGSAFLRGLTGNQTLLMIDGIRLNNSTMRYGPNQYFNTIDLFSIGRLEVLRGSGSVQYGSDAMGGTIQAFTPDLGFSSTRSIDGTITARAVTGGMEQSLRGSARYQGPRTAFLGGLTVRNFGDLIGGDTTGLQSPSGYREMDFDLKGKIRIDRATELTLLFQRVHQDTVPVFHKIQLENYRLNQFCPQNRNLAYARISRKINRGVLNSITFTASWQQTHEGRISQKNDSPILREESDRVQISGFNAECTTADDGWKAVHGVEVYHDRVNSTRKDTGLTTGQTTIKRGLYPDGATMTSLAAFTIHTYELPKWSFSAGARFNQYLIHLEDPSLGMVRLTPSALVANMAILRKTGDFGNLFLSANSGFRAPNIDDLGTLGIVDFRYEIPNPELEPEHSFQYQAGYKINNSRFRAEAYLFRNNLSNLIVRSLVPGDTLEGYPVYLKENVEKARITGAETNGSLYLSNTLTLSGALTWTHGQNVTKNEPLRRSPPLFGNVSLDYRNRNFLLMLEWLSAARQDRLAAADKQDNRIPPGGTPGWNLFNVHAGYSWRMLSVHLSLLNLFNADYRYHGSGINGQGRSLMGTLRINLTRQIGT